VPTVAEPGPAALTGLAAAPLPPGATIGILGGGQLGRLMAIAARRFGYRSLALDPDPEAPAAGVVERLIVASYADREAAFALADGSDVVTYELEHVDADVVAALAADHAVRPGLAALRATQDRLAERRFLVGQGAGLAAWHAVHDLDDLRSGVADLGLPCRLKAAFGGYDGRSQLRLTSPDALPAAFATLGGGARPLLLEREIAFAAELSVVCARGLDSATRPFPVARNRHDEGILVESVVPAGIPTSVAEAAQALAAQLAEALGLVGLLTVELFLLPDGERHVNELAPRVHNSGHWTLDACATSQFEQHVRAISGLPLGPVEMTAPAAAMVNLLGSGAARPARLEGLAAALADPDVRITLYDKRRVFERRKMGHLTALATGPEEALARARAASRLLSWGDSSSSTG
jgi:5-(carboxyamino)imidazole ribonucleotide synthase